MSGELEKFLKKQRDTLDIETPDDPVIWEGIRQDLLTTRKRSRRVMIRIRNVAAVLVLLVSMGYMVVDLLGMHPGRSFSLADVDPVLAKKEKEYRTLIGIKQQEAGTRHLPDQDIINELMEEIQRLDTIYEQSMKDLRELGPNEQAIQTIFDTYEKKIYLLELIILETQKIQNYEAEEHLFL
jgi:hypothetical protein